jgi:tRNA(Ile)-lysidine synthase
VTGASLLLSPEEAVRRFLRDLEKPARVLVAISGGSDSTGLLVALSQFAGDGISLHAATIDHGLRRESAEEARMVAALCERLGVPHVVRRWEGEKPASGISAAARDARYRLLAGIAAETGATALVTGHTADDQAETVTMRAARSAEDDPGLAGMAEAVLVERRFWLLRPFLRTRRADIRAFLQGQGFSWIDDPSNLDPHYERVRTRSRLAERGILDIAAWDAAAKQRTARSNRAADLLEEHASLQHGVLARLTPGFFDAEVDLRRYALGHLAAVLGGRTHGPGRQSMDRVVAVLDGSVASRVTAGRVIFERRREGLYLCRENRGLQPLRLGPGQEAIWDGRYRIANSGANEVIIGPTAPDRKEAASLFPDVVPAVAARATAVMPCAEGVCLVLSGRGALEASDKGSILVQPVLAPFDRFLPQFDYILAARLAILFGCDDFPPLRVKVSVRKR